MTETFALRLHEADNVVTALRDLAAGEGHSTLSESSKRAVSRFAEQSRDARATRLPLHAEFHDGNDRMLGTGCSIVRAPAAADIYIAVNLPLKVEHAA